MLRREAFFQSAAWRTVRREAHTPKGLLLGILAGLTAIGLASEGIDRAWPMVVGNGWTAWRRFERREQRRTGSAA